MVRPIDEAALELYSATHGDPTFADRSAIARLIHEAVADGLGGDLTREFLAEEWTELVDAWGVDNADAYATIPRTGRRTRLGPRQRDAAWEVFARLRESLQKAGLVSWSMIYTALAQSLRDGQDLPFNHVVVDEAQDLSVAQVRFLGELAKARPNAVFLAGDIGQRIFRLPFSWTRLSLDVRGRSHSLKINYRTSHQIRVMADRLLPPAITDMDGIEEGRRGTISVFDGPEPQLIFAADETEEQEQVRSWLAGCLESGIAAPEIGLLVRSERQFGRAKAAIASAGTDEDANAIRIVSMHDAKGLEFRAVAVLACDEDVIPDQARMAGVGDIADLEAFYETERHLLYVACTRARDRLLVSCVEPGSEFLDDLHPR